MDNRTKEAIRLLGVYSAGRFDVWMLAGSSRASCRAHIMSALMGAKMPQSKSGVTALRSEFYSRLSITGNCEAQREDAFIALCKEVGTSLKG